MKRVQRNIKRDNRTLKGQNREKEKKVPKVKESQSSLSKLNPGLKGHISQKDGTMMTTHLGA